MDKKKLKKLVEDPRFISGIYNYCDRWCERCAFAHRCLNYAMVEVDQNYPDQETVDSEAFWQEIEGNLKLAMELLEEMAKEQGIDFDKVDVEKISQQQLERRKQSVKSHDLSQSAHRYIQLVDEWFDKNRNIFEQREQALNEELELGIEKKYLDKEAASIIDATEVIRWYQPQIYVKLMRALRHPGRYKFEDKIQNDVNGSVKVALIGIDRSIGAWGKFIDLFADQSDSILDILLHLDRLRRKMEKAFPNARSFKRPGFDMINEVDQVQ